MPDEIASGTADLNRTLWLNLSKLQSGQTSLAVSMADNQEKFHRFTWHYINMPLYLEASDERELAGKLDHNMSTEFSSSAKDEV